MALNITAHIARGGNVVPVAAAAAFYADYPKTPGFYVEVTEWTTHALTRLGPFPLQVAVGIGLDIEASVHNNAA